MPLPARDPIRHCNRCGSSIGYQVPADDNRARALCPSCGHIQYENPINVVGTVPRLDDGRVLLCRRAIEPRRGLWTLPAGFMELGECVQTGALRETQEEAGAEVELRALVSMISVLPVGQVHLYFAARCLSERLDPGPETLEARFFHPHEIPWEELAFRTVRRTLEHALEGEGLLVESLR
ncbi:NUDIX hydrolase [Inhella sp.]|uniref:NUDIX hydrolase n=1 Tax=Inhella sp. TaxID=1921806 RepID=UPI0035B0EB7C